MFVELHLIQNFAPSNLNRGDTGAPKSSEFGGYRRARISSQCFKRAIRKDGGFDRFLAGMGGVRTRRLILEIAERLAGTQPAPEATVKIVSEVFRDGGIERVPVGGNAEAEKDSTKLILFMDAPAIEDMVAQFRKHWDGLSRGTKDSKSEVRLELGTILAKAVRAPDIALFGRMIEIKPNQPFGKLQLGVDGACQVAHALSTNAAQIEFDYYTAVDDLKKPWEHAGADMLGTVEFNSACFYRYANVDLEQLKRNLGGGEDLVRRTLRAFLLASIEAIPTGKQTSMAAQNPPSFVFVVARERRLWSLANAFVKPISPRQGNDLVKESIRALDAYWGRLCRVYGEDGIDETATVTIDEDVDLPNLDRSRVESVPMLLDRIDSAVRFAPNGIGSQA